MPIIQEKVPDEMRHDSVPMMGIEQLFCEDDKESF